MFAMMIQLSNLQDACEDAFRVKNSKKDIFELRKILKIRYRINKGKE